MGVKQPVCLAPLLALAVLVGGNWGAGRHASFVEARVSLPVDSVYCGFSSSAAQGQQVVMDPNSTLDVTCPTSLTVRTSRDRKRAVLTCASDSGSPEPRPGQPCPSGVHNPDVWHPPVGPGGCYYGHEHGDPPPGWVTSSRWPPMFTHPGNTPGENIYKHTSFKGFQLEKGGIQVYLIMHLDTNPNGHTSRFHSYQVWARDPAGNVSYWNLWADFGEGNNAGPNVRPVASCGGDTSLRPIMMVNFPQCSLNFETWYSRAGAPEWGWDLGFSVKPQYYHGPRVGESSTPDLTAMGTWLPTGLLNDERRAEIAWYEFRPHPTGTFYATQFGEIVSGPRDRRCGTTRVIGGKSYPVLCLQQHIAPTMRTFAFPGNSAQKTYDVTGVQLPN